MTVVQQGTYKVEEAGSEYQFGTQHVDHPTTPENYLAKFRDNFRIRVLERPSKNDLVFELVNVDASFANALRRILLAEVPTVAIERVYMWNNSSLVHDEILSHRLGLIPIHADARFLDYWAEDDPDEQPTDNNTIVFRLGVKCKKSDEQGKRANHAGGDDDYDDDEAMDQVVDPTQNKEHVEAATEAATARPYRFPRDRPYTKHVYSGDMKWLPQGDQEERFGSIRPVHEDILIAKLRPGQEIELECHARVGVGKDHAKFSPVATAGYRLLPKVVLKEPVYDEVAEELVHVYEPGVFKLVPTNPKEGDPKGTRVKAVVDNPYACTMSRNFLRHPILAKAVEITRDPNHFIFSVESVGMYSPGVLVAEALRTLQKKCANIMDLADEAMAAESTQMEVE